MALGFFSRLKEGLTRSTQKLSEGISTVFRKRRLDDEALEELAAFDQRRAQVVEMRYFGGLTMQEIAEVLNVHVNTVLRDWTAARAWLFGRLTGQTHAT